MSLGDDMRAEVRGAILQLNQQITVLMQVIDAVEHTGGTLLRLQSHNQNVIVAGGKTNNVIPEELRRIITEYRLLVLMLEDYVNQ